MHTSKANFQRLTKTGLAFALLLSLFACSKHQDPGNATAVALPTDIVEAKQQRYSESTSASKQILFGDLHVHSTFSPDAFATASPIIGGGGLRPPSTACDFARYCSALDFWSINDHAEGLTPQRWRETKDAVRECNAISDNPQQPDLVTFLGWEWSQVSHYDRKSHYGHKNVIFLDTDDEQVPSRPIAAPREQLGKSPMGRFVPYILALRDFENRGYYQSVQRYYDELAEIPACEKGIDAKQLPENCHETAADPAELFAKLNQWGFEHMVIPHGNAWGLNTPPGTSFDKQLNRTQHSPEQQFLFELFSGHGNSEEYRDWRAVAFDSENRAYCPDPSDNYEPCCWRAGKIIRKRCDEAGIDAGECERREYEARQNFVDAGVSGHLTVPGQTAEDWLNCGQCEDCFMPGMDHRPATTGQYALAISNFDDPDNPLRFRFGFIGSSDNHTSRGGTGYKEVARLGMTESYGPRDARLASMTAGESSEPVPSSTAFDLTRSVNLNNKRNMERQSSFWMTGGLVAVHSENRQRDAIWQGMKDKEVYATSGDRMLLWFDLLEGEKTYPMGSEVNIDGAAQFKVTAIGAFKQLPGCPDYAEDILGAEQVQDLCLGECYNPSDERKLIDRIEIVRVRPQSYPGEPVESLIEDPWRSFDCAPDAAGCQIEFSDDENTARDAVYYARAIQEPSDTINAGGLRCERDEQGQCIDVNPCYGDYRTDIDDDCTAPSQERAWSSPIFVDRN